MSPPHSHAHGPHAHGHASRNLGIAFALNLVFTLVEVAGGLWTNSMAILSDALHDAGDSFSLGLAWYLQVLSTRAADALFTYGYRRFSSLGALVTGVVLAFGLGFVVWHAVGRLAAPQPVHAPGMLALAVVGILFNGAAAWKLGGGHSLNERVARWHLLEDTLGWVAVLLGSAAIWAWGWLLLDPLLALGIALFILWNVVRNLRQVLRVFLQGAPQGFDLQAFEREMAGIDGVVDAHHTHTWTLDGERHVFSTHLVLGRHSSRDDVLAAKQRVHALLRAQDFEHITVEVELEGERCAADAGHGHGHGHG